MVKWVLYYTKAATQTIYGIPRGPAGEITTAIRSLSIDPRPPGYQTLERPNTYSMQDTGYTIIYELIEENRIIKILLIE